MLRVYKKHPSVDDRMDKSAQQALSYLVYIHIIFSVYIFGNSDIFEKPGAGIGLQEDQN